MKQKRFDPALNTTLTTQYIKVCQRLRRRELCDFVKILNCLMYARPKVSFFEKVRLRFPFLLLSGVEEHVPT
jgi:hypothetical protein